MPISANGNTLVIRVYARPRASKTKFVGLHEDRIKLQVAAPPVDGKANAVIIKYVAGFFDVPKSAVRITRGDKGKQKTLEVDGVGLEDARARLNLPEP